MQIRIEVGDVRRRTGDGRWGTPNCIRVRIAADPDSELAASEKQQRIRKMRTETKLVWRTQQTRRMRNMTYTPRSTRRIATEVLAKLPWQQQVGGDWTSQQN